MLGELYTPIKLKITSKRILEFTLKKTKVLTSPFATVSPAAHSHLPLPLV